MATRLGNKIWTAGRETALGSAVTTTMKSRFAVGLHSSQMTSCGRGGSRRHVVILRGAKQCLRAPPSREGFRGGRGQRQVYGESRGIDRRGRGGSKTKQVMGPTPKPNVIGGDAIMKPGECAIKQVGPAVRTYKVFTAFTIHKKMRDGPEPASAGEGGGVTGS